MNESRQEGDNSINMIFACGVEFESERMHSVSWIEDETEARAMFENQYDYCFRGISWCEDWEAYGSEFNEPDRFVFLVAQLRVPEIWKTLMEEGEGDIFFPNAHIHDLDEELSRYLIYAEVVTANDDYEPVHMSPLMAVEKAISCIKSHCFFFTSTIESVLESTKEG